MSKTQEKKIREFDLGQILSVVTDKLVHPIGGVYEILNYMTGDNLYTHQLPRAIDECRPELLRQHPQLADVNADSVSGATYRDWLDEQTKRFGKRLSVLPLPLGAHLNIDPIQELAAMVGEEKMIVVTAKE